MKHPEYAKNRNWMIRHNSYAFLYYKYFDFSKFSHIGIIRRGGQKHTTM